MKPRPARSMPAMQDPVCVYCGTSRPAQVSNCPKCGQPWIDQRVVPLERQERPEEAAIAPQAPKRRTRTRRAASEPEGRVRPVLVGFGIGLIIIAALAFVFQRGDGTTPATTVAATPTTAPAITILTPTTSTTTTSTTTSTTTTTLPPPPLPDPVGDPIPVGDLELAVNFIGPLDFGEPADEVIGRLISTFGEPDSYQVLVGSLGLCPDDEGIGATWGPLAIVATDDVFAGYRLDSFSPDHPAAGLETLSGLQVGDTVAVLRSTYLGLDVQLIEDELRFELRNGAGQLLLWGPVSSVDDEGVVEGIYSPNPCDGGAG